MQFDRIFSEFNLLRLKMLCLCSIFMPYPLALT